MGTAGIEDSF